VASPNKVTTTWDFKCQLLGLVDDHFRVHHYLDLNTAKPVLESTGGGTVAGDGGEDNLVTFKK